MSSVATAPITRKQEFPMSTDLVKSTQAPPVIQTPEDFTASLSRWRSEQYHVLTPFANFSGLAASHGILTTLVTINTDKQVGEIYDGLPFLKKNENPELAEVALAKNALRKIAEGLGVSTRLQYISVAVIRNYWHVKAIASYRGIDGSIVTREASLEWDLRDGSDRLKGWTPNQVSEARKHGLRACETRAINAVIRECGCGIKQAYRREELRRPFVTVRVMFQPDLSDPETRRQVTEHALRGTNALYSGSAPTHSEPHDAFIDAETVPATSTAPAAIGTGQTTAAQQQTPAAPALPEGAVLIVNLERVNIPKRDKTGFFPKWKAIDSNGVEHVTIKSAFGASLEQVFNAKRPVEITSTENGYQENEITELLPVGDAKQGGLY